MSKKILVVFLALALFTVLGCTQIIYTGPDGEYLKINTLFEDPKIDWLQFRDVLLQTYDGSTTSVEASGVTPAGPVKIKIGG